MNFMLLMHPEFTTALRERDVAESRGFLSHRDGGGEAMVRKSKVSDASSH